MIYIYGHAPSDHPEEFGDKELALRYFRDWLPRQNKKMRREYPAHFFWFEFGVEGGDK